MADIFQRAKMEEVRYSFGTFDLARKSPKTVPAPFDILYLDDGLYFLPADAPAVGGPPVSSSICYPLSGTVGTDTQDEAFYQGRGGFFLTEKLIIMGEHEMGDWKGSPDTWKGMHQLGML
jgi:hypothetical protein